MDHEQRQGPVVALPHQAPLPPTNFVGRADTLRDIHALVLEQAPTVLGLRGGPGVGKTTLAAMLAQQFAALYPDAQLYIDLQAAAQPLAYSTVMGQVIQAFKPLARLPTDEAALQAAYRQVLHGRRALLIFDNIGSGAEVSQLVPPAGCLMVVIAGERLSLRGLRAFSLAGLPVTEAKRLLLSLAPDTGDQADRLVGLCGQNPLALHLVGSALSAHKNLAPLDYADRLERERSRQPAVSESEAAAALSYSLLPADLRRMWRFLAVFPADFDRHAAGAVWGVNNPAAAKALDLLRRLGLVASPNDARRYRLHDVLRRMALARQETGERQDTRQRHAEYFVNVIGAADQYFRQGGERLQRGLRLFDQERSNVLTGQTWAAAGLDKDDASARLANAYGLAGANVLAARLPLQGQLAWFETASRAARRLGDRKAEISHLSKLGSVYRHLSDPRRAAKYYDQCLRLSRELTDRHQEGVALDKLGLAWADMGYPRRAAEFYKQSLLIARELGNRADEARTSWNLGLAYKELDDLPAAISAMQVCVDYERGTRHPNAEADAAELDWLRARLAGRVQR